MGSLSSFSISKDGLLVGVFSNGLQADPGAARAGELQQPAGSGEGRRVGLPLDGQLR